MPEENATMLTPVESIKLVLNQAKMNFKLQITILPDVKGGTRYKVTIHGDVTDEMVDESLQLLKQAWPGCLVFYTERLRGFSGYAKLIIDDTRPEIDEEEDDLDETSS